MEAGEVWAGNPEVVASGGRSMQSHFGAKKKKVQEVGQGKMKGIELKIGFVLLYIVFGKNGLSKLLGAESADFFRGT